MIIDIILVFILFLIVFSYCVRFSTYNVHKLLLYHNYQDYMKKHNVGKYKMFFKRLWKIMFTYLPLGIAIGIILIFVGILFPPLANRIGQFNFQEIVISSFIVAFLSLMSIRLSILTDKTSLFEKMGIPIERRSEDYYKKQKEFVESFIFSTIFLAMFSSVMYAGIRIIMEKDITFLKLIELHFTNIIGVTIVFLIAFFIGAIFVELMLTLVGVHKAYITKCNK